jgi:hypothetical protein
VRRPSAGDAAPTPTSTARGSFRSPDRRRYRNAEACSTTSPPQPFTSRNAAPRRHLRHIAKRFDNIRFSCGPPPKAENPGLEPHPPDLSDSRPPPARLLQTSVMASDEARLAERRQNYLSASGLVSGCSAPTDARRAPLAVILSTGLLSLKDSGLPVPHLPSWPSRKVHGKGACQIDSGRRGLPECHSTTGLPVPRLPSWPSRKVHGKRACQIDPGRRGLPECPSTIGLPVPRLPSWPSRKVHGKGACQIDPGRRGLPECPSTIGLPVPRSPSWPSRRVHGKGACQIDPGRRGLPE